VRGRTHVAMAVLPAALLLGALSSGGAAIDASVYLAAPVSAAIGALAPDIDHRRSRIGNGLPAEILVGGIGVLLALFGGAWLLSRLPVLRALTFEFSVTDSPIFRWAIVAVLASVALLVLSFVASAALKHRGPTHSLVFAAGTSAVFGIGCAVAGAPWQYGLVFGWGYLSHLMGDAMTASGCRSLLWPITRKR